MGIEKIFVVGAGGIGSHLCKQIVQKVVKEQLRDLKEIIIYDPYRLEMKNKLYTIYECDSSQIGKLKVEILKEQLEMELMALDRTIKITINARILDTFNFDNSYDSNCVYISSVDGSKFRERMFKESTSQKTVTSMLNRNNHWIDCRSKGARFIALRNPLTQEGIEILAPYFQHSDIEGDSCQVTADLMKNQIQVGNELAATCGIKFLLNMDRGLPNELFIDYQAIPSRD